jgi:predicted nucleic-acid-binding Zn-ribbon protein
MSLEMKRGIIKHDVANSLTIMELFKHCKNLKQALKTQYKKFYNFTNPNTHYTIFYLFTSLVVTNYLNKLFELPW